MTRFLLFACVLCGTALLSAVYIAGGYSYPGSVLVFLGLAWCIGILYRWTWITAAELFVYYVFAACGFLLRQSTGLLAGRSGLAAGLLLGGAIFILLAADLSDFDARLNLAAPEDDVAGLQRRHFLRLLVFALTGGALSAAALALHISYTFEWSVVLIIFAVWGLVQVVNRLFQKSR
jgi:hypothetical protein